jgi:phosphoenolpyruvate-protein phosphotransferase (PTS system enzyme I)
VNVAEIRLQGRAAAPGLYFGPAVVVASLVSAKRVPGNPVEELAALTLAIGQARDEVAALVARSAGEAARIMEIQVALLEDDALSEEARAAIARGTAADAAWSDALANEIAAYDTAEDEYFRARAADLTDIRDRVLRRLSGAPPIPVLAPGAVIVARDLPPSVFLAIDWSRGGGIVLGDGSPTSHVAMLARSRDVPMVVGIGRHWESLTGSIVVDGYQGVAIANPVVTTLAEVERRRATASHADDAARARASEPADTVDGTRIAVMINVADPAELASVDPAWCDGIGLVRTEFLLAGTTLRDEERQLALYRQLIEWAAGRPVTIRTLDAGGDKPIPGYTVDGESNPFLGMRGIRLSLRHPDVFGVQLRAMARAAMLGPLKVMLPMVTTPADLGAARRLLDEAVAALHARGVAAKAPPLGIMVEVPGTAIAIDQFDAAFFSIGSNDLVQYVTAASRDGAEMAEYAQLSHPGVLRLIANVAAYGIAAGREVSLCGDAAADPRSIPALLEAGVRVVSVAPSAIARTKAAIRGVRLDPGANTGRPQSVRRSVAS